MTLQPITPSSFERPACRLLAATRRQMPGTDRHLTSPETDKRILAYSGTHYGDKLAGHVSRDATAIHAREKAEAKPEAPPKLKRGKRGRRLPVRVRTQTGRKDEPPAPPPDPTRLQQQLERDLQDNLADLPAACDWGCKKNSQGKVEMMNMVAGTSGCEGRSRSPPTSPSGCWLSRPSR
jgi:hypothetical protein